MAVQIQSEIKRLFLRWRYAEAQRLNIPLIESLQSWAFEILGNVSSGNIIQSTSGGGYATSLQPSLSGSQINPEDLTAMAELFLEVYEDLSSSLTTDADRLSIMMADYRMNGFNSMAGIDVTLLDAGRFPA